MKIGIDPGHGGDAPGCNVIGGTTEAAYVLGLGLEFADLLAPEYSLKMSRTSDRRVALGKRAELLAGSDFVLCLHVNSQAFTYETEGENGPVVRPIVPAPKPLHGLSCFHLPDDLVAINAASATARARPLELTGNAQAIVRCQLMPGHWTDHARNCLQLHKCSALLVELFFGSSEHDSTYALSDEGRQAMLVALKAGVDAAANTLRWKKV